MKLITRLQRSKYVLLVQPSYPLPQKSRNHKLFCPLPLLKFGGYLRDHHIPFKLCHIDNIKEGKVDLPSCVDTILVTTLFTWYSQCVRECVENLREMFPHSHIIGGGVYASLLPNHCREYCGFDEIITGVVCEVEQHKPCYDLVNTDYQILQTSRGCIRRCKWCATYKLEPMQEYKKSIHKEVQKKKLVFYDNNLLANPYIENILYELIRLRRHKKITQCEAQSGLDGRLLTKNTAQLLYKAGFKKPSIAWDGRYNEKENIKEQIELLLCAGYQTRHINVFILYNYEISYKECEQKRAYLSKLGVQVYPCRYVPLTATSDGYNPYLQEQSRKEYYIHPVWTDKEVRQFKRNCRQHNICKRYQWKYWSRNMEKRKISNKETTHIQALPTSEARKRNLFISDEEQII